MYVKRNISWGLIARFTWRNILFFIVWAGLIFSVYYFLNWTFTAIPFQPLNAIGIAVAFYIGFENSQSYDCFWVYRYRHLAWGNVLCIPLRQPSTFSLKEYKAVEKIKPQDHIL